ncbi:hypothetical protein EL06_20860 [Salmonella enterica subsp. diarizonae]|uniref:Uncharacterized protein n=1 Tax=Salmonella diarizonae TaxID=59204 RepID=A0A6C8Y089_SALDZ|nr:hypothetical protein [Salmonella enterica subsp. diarizonae]
MQLLRLQHRADEYSSLLLRSIVAMNFSGQAVYEPSGEQSPAFTRRAGRLRQGHGTVVDRKKSEV